MGTDMKKLQGEGISMLNKKKKKTYDMTPEESRKVIGPNLSFAAAEAYKRLRTNLMFSFPDRKKCRVIGVTSALQSEGKTTTAINIAYTMAQTGNKVLLLEGDLRLPTIAKRLGVHSKPGVSNLLAGQCTGNDVLQRSRFLDGVHIIVAGDIPPNPAELLASPQMEQTMEAVSKIFDVIILDLPPVCVVSDALIASKLIDGMIVVARQDFCDRKAMSETIRQLKFAETRILGFVVTGSDIQKKNYKRYKKDSYDGYGYGYGHEHTAAQTPRAPQPPQTPV